MRPSLRPLALAAALTALVVVVAGCDMLGIESAEKIAAAREADGKAIGGACRHAGDITSDNGGGVYAVRSACPIAGIPTGTGDIAAMFGFSG